jgi:hypothetical protein
MRFWQKRNSTGESRKGRIGKTSIGETKKSRRKGGGGDQYVATATNGVVSADGKTTMFRVHIPDNVEPGQEFQVYASNRIVRVKCPPNSAAGQFLQITVPVDPTAGSGSQSRQPPRSSLPPDSANVAPVPNIDGGPPASTVPNVAPVPNNDGGPPAYTVTIPEGIHGGQEFPVTIQGQRIMIFCPVNTTPGTKVRIVPPPPPEGHDDPKGGNNKSLSKDDDEETQLFEVEVPDGVQPGESFALLAGGVRVLVTCALNAGPGQRIRFKLPKALTQKREPRSEAVQIKLSYDKDGWTRTIRVSDMKFQWVRMDDNGDVDNNTRFDAEKSAYVRKLEFVPGPDDRIRDGVMSLVPAAEAFVDSRIKGNNGKVLVTYSEIADAQVRGFEEKAVWFQEKCKLLRVPWDLGHMRINVRRNCLLEDSVDAVISLNREDLRKHWLFEFINEVGLDAGGLAREWFELVTKQIFDPNVALWQTSEANQMCMQINPASSM